MTDKIFVDPEIFEVISNVDMNHGIAKKSLFNQRVFKDGEGTLTYSTSQVSLQAFEVEVISQYRSSMNTGSTKH
ncbi:hypothetical protein BPAE_0206g00100 [Botrytis paeoniae]|uniref:Uncharacterized protein n=1 Tax=Botrytis paeoniae TaxID=278948 RepID=A0A4Z1FB46_9HELO|nr:hypothetical protein BPAE_0206g00100 [Botrytis paeoniae]